MNLEVYTHGFLQNFVTLHQKVMADEITLSDIENYIIEAQKPKDRVNQPDLTPQSVPKPGEIVQPKPKERTDLFAILPVPALSECCGEQIYLISLTEEQRRNRVQLAFLCGECNKEYEVK